MAFQLSTKQMAKGFRINKKTKKEKIISYFFPVYTKFKTNNIYGNILFIAVEFFTYCSYNFLAGYGFYKFIGY